MAKNCSSQLQAATIKTEGICTEEEISGKIEVNEPSNCDIALSDNESQNMLAPSAYQ